MQGARAGGGGVNIPLQPHLPGCTTATGRTGNGDQGCGSREARDTSRGPWYGQYKSERTVAFWPGVEGSVVFRARNLV